MQNFRRHCDECKTPLAGRRGHGFVSPSGLKIRCGDRDECSERRDRRRGVYRRKVEGWANPEGAT